MGQYIRNHFSLKAAAKQVGIGPRVLTKKLVELDIFEHRNGRNMPKREYVQQGYFGKTTGSKVIGNREIEFEKAVVTPAGLNFLRYILHELEKNRPLGD